MVFLENYLQTAENGLERTEWNRKVCAQKISGDVKERLNEVEDKML